MIFTKSKNTYFATPKTDVKDKISLEIGDSKQPDFKPQQKIMRWDNEVNVSLRLVHDEKSPTVSKSGDKVIWDGEKVKAEIYPIIEGEGGNEFEITLKGKPESNVVKFTLVDKGVEYFYQPELEDSEVLEMAEREKITLLEAKRKCRPENVVGSYAIYASENKINYVGEKEYKCGKVGHIYRPKIEDANGDWVWGELHIENGILSVTIPQEFLDKAVYPVRHAAGLTIGYTSVGGSNRSSSPYSWTHYKLSTEGSPINITSVSAYLTDYYGSSIYAKGIIGNNAINPSDGYSDGNSAVGWSSTGLLLSQGSYSYNYSWKEFSIDSGSQTITKKDTFYKYGTRTAERDCQFGFISSSYQGGVYIRYDTVSSWWCYAAYGTVNVYSNPSSISQLNSRGETSVRLSIYATYTAGASSSIKTINGLAKASVKTVNGLAIASVKSWNGLT